MKHQDFDSIMNQLEENDNFGLEYWTYNTMTRKIPIDRERMLDSLSVINNKLIERGRTPFTISEFKDYIMSNNITYIK